MTQTTLEDYFKEGWSQLEGGAIIDYRLRCHIHEGIVTFYIHPMGRNGNTPDFKVVGNTLEQLNVNV